MFAPLMIFAGMGIQLCRRLSSKYRFGTVLIASLIALHIGVFAARFLHMYPLVTVESPVSLEGAVAKELYQCLDSDLKAGRTIHLPDQMFTRIFRALSLEDLPLQVYLDPEQPSLDGIVVFDFDSTRMSPGLVSLRDSLLAGPDEHTLCEVPHRGVSLPVVRFPKVVK